MKELEGTGERVGGTGTGVGRDWYKSWEGLVQELAGLVQELGGTGTGVGRDWYRS